MGVKKTPFTQIKGRRILKQNGGIRKKPRWAWKKKGSAKMTNKQKGILFNLLSCVGFGCMNACVQLAGDLPSMQKCFFRNSGALLVATFIILSKHIGFSVPKAARPSLLARSIYGTIGIFCNFYAVDRLTLADANLLNRLSPFFALLFSVFRLKESIRPLHGLTMVGAFLGSLLIIKPSFANMNLVPSLIGALGGLIAGVAATELRLTSKKGSPEMCTVFYFSLLSTLIVLPFFIWDYTPMSAYQWVCLCGVGVFAGIGQFGLTKAYACAPSREISIYEYAQVVFSALLGFWLFDQLPDGYSVLGYLVIFGMSGIMFLYNNQMLFFKNAAPMPEEEG